MAAGKEIRSKITSVKNTQKITKAMEMVATSKMRKAQEGMRSARPYSEKIRNVIAHLSYAHTEYQHTYMTPRKEIKRVGFIIISTDRGLCGGLNSNLFRELTKQMQDWQNQNIGIDVCLIGKKAISYFTQLPISVLGQTTNIGDTPSVDMLIGTVKIMLDAYMQKNIDRLYLATNRFINSMTQKPIAEQVLPIQQNDDEQLKHYWDYIYEPDAKEILDYLLQRYIESLIYQSVVENIACEQSARMVAMKSASDNAATLIDDLQLVYNKARQTAITQELSEIVSGAAAV